MSDTQSNYYALYIESVRQLAETIVIKSEVTAQAMNRKVTDYNGSLAVDSLDPTSWKYYQNLAGEYHFTDTEMSVTSMDTLQRITFSKENLTLHRATARGYVYGTRAYKELVALYPEQETLILGILYPVDKTAAIAAKNGAILGFPPGLVEDNEYSLVAELQAFIDGYFLRWTNMQYALSDDLYAATALGVLYLQLVPAILNLRLQACRTNEAHSFHVRQYLASHGRLDQYLDQMTLEQSLYFYRNISYIERHSGQAQTFESLVEHIMTSRSLPLGEYVMRHSLAEQPAALQPEASFVRTAVNDVPSQNAAVTLTLDEMLQRQDDKARDNERVRLEDLDAIEQQFQDSLSNVVITKALESDMIDYSNATPYTLEDTLMNHWLWLAAAGLYTQAIVTITNPQTGERIPLNVKDAWVMMYYAYCRTIGVVLSEVPAFYAKRVQRIPLPSVDQMWAVADHRLVSRSIAEQARNWQPALKPMISTEAFYEICVAINTACQYQRGLVSSQEHLLRRSMVFGMVNQLYSDNICHLEPAGTLYADWFAERNLKIEDFTDADLASVLTSLTQDATGLSLHVTGSVRDVQASMVRLLTQLSSYTVQFMAKINQSDIHVDSAGSVRVGNLDSRSQDHQYVSDLVAEALSLRAKPLYGVQVPVSVLGQGAAPASRVGESAHLEITVKPNLPEGADMVTHYQIDAARVSIHATVDLPPNTEDIIPVPGVEVVLTLSDEERSGLRDFWRDRWVTWPPVGQYDLDKVITRPFLNGLTYTPPV